MIFWNWPKFCGGPAYRGKQTSEIPGSRVTISEKVHLKTELKSPLSSAWRIKTIYLLVGSSVVCGNVRKSGLTWAQCWTKYKFSSLDTILTILQHLCQVLNHTAAEVDRYHPKSQVGTLYISRECLFPETHQRLCKILSPVPAARLLPDKDGWPVLVCSCLLTVQSFCSSLHSAQSEKFIYSLKILQRAEFQTVETSAAEFNCKFSCKYYMTSKLCYKLDLLYSCYIWQHW